VDLCSNVELGNRDVRHVKRDLSKEIQDCHKQLLDFTSEDDILLFEENTVKKLDWAVRDFARSVQDSTKGGGSPTNCGKRLCSEFEQLVVACKSRARVLASAKVKSTFCPPTMQLGVSCRSRTTGRSRSTALDEEIIDDELELEKLQADAEADKIAAKAEADRRAAEARFDAEIRKKQAVIQAKI